MAPAVRDETAHVKCPSCGAMNRLRGRALEPGKRAVCGRCKTPLPISTSGSETRPTIVTDAQFSAEVEHSPVPVLVDLWAEWCGPCHMLAPTIEELARELNGRIRVAKLNIDENPRTAARFRIQSIPTLLLFKNGREIDRLVGVLPKEEIIRHLQLVMATD